jgi:cytochrome c-type biogenesis protein CcmH/NrfF
MVTVTVNVLWVIVVLAIIIAFALAIRRRRLASRESKTILCLSGTQNKKIKLFFFLYMK